MKIGIDARSLEENRTGVRRFLENLLREWKKEQAEVVLYFQKRVPEDLLDLPTEWECRVLGGVLGKHSNFLFQHWQLPRALRADRVEVFFSPFYLKPVCGSVKTVICLHDISYAAHPEWFDGKSQLILRWLSRWSAHTADKIFTVSEFSKSEIMRLYGTPAEKITVAHLAPDTNFSTEVDAAVLERFRRKHALGKFALSVGSLFTRRRVPELLTAWQKFAATNSGWQLVLVGKNHTFPHLDIDGQIAIVNRTLGEESVKRLEAIGEEELKAAYAASEVVVYLSEYEGFGLPVVEAQFFGKPVITSRNSSLVEVGRNSVEFVENNEPEQIITSLSQVLLQRARQEELVQKGKENLRRFDWGRTAQKFWRELEILAERK